MAFFQNRFPSLCPFVPLSQNGTWRGRQSEELQQRFRDAGVQVEWIPLESLIDGYGAAHCMTQVLLREAWKDGTPTTVRRPTTTRAQEQHAYRLDGTVAKESDRGVIIRNGKKSIRWE